MSHVFGFYISASAPPAPADVSEDPTEPQPEASTEDAEATSSEAAEDTAAQEASPDPSSVAAEDFPKARPLEEVPPEHDEADMPDETPNDFSRSTELAPDDTPAASSAADEAAAGALPAAAEAAESTGGEDSARVQTYSDGKVSFRNVLPKDYLQIFTKPHGCGQTLVNYLDFCY